MPVNATKPTSLLRISARPMQHLQATRYQQGEEKDSDTENDR